MSVYPSSRYRKSHILISSIGLTMWQLTKWPESFPFLRPALNGEKHFPLWTYLSPAETRLKSNGAGLLPKGSLNRARKRLRNQKPQRLENIQQLQPIRQISRAMLLISLENHLSVQRLCRLITQLPICSCMCQLSPIF